MEHLHDFYNAKLDGLPVASQEEISEGVAVIVAAQPKEKIYTAMKLYCDPILERLKMRAMAALADPKSKPLQEAVAGKSSVPNLHTPLVTDHFLSDTLQLLTVFITNVHPYYEPGETNQAVVYCQEILPVLAKIAETFTESVAVLERLCRCWRHMVLAYRTAILPLLEELATQISTGFEKTRQGCVLWATDSVLREFALGAEFVAPETSQAIYRFFEQQAFAVLHIMNDLPPQDLPDGELYSYHAPSQRNTDHKSSHRGLLPPYSRRLDVLS